MTIKKKTPMGGAERQSNFELLRLLAMLMVLNLHSFHGYDSGIGLFKFIDFFRESSSICAVDVFILISGYFGIHWKVKSFFNLFFQVLFYSFGIYIVCCWLGVVSFNKIDFIKCAGATFNSWVFIARYFALYFISPCLNSFAEKTSSRSLFLFIFIYFIAENFIFYDRGVSNFFLMYLIGRFLKKANAVHTMKIRVVQCYWIVTLIITIFAYLLNVLMNYDAVKMTTSFIAYSYSAPLVILQAISIFIFFGHLKINSKLINWLAASCLSIFLIHMHPAVVSSNISYFSFTKDLYGLPIINHIFILFLLFICVFFGSIIIDKFRIFISRHVYNGIISIWNRLPHKVRDFDAYIPIQIKEIIGK